MELLFRKPNIRFLVVCLVLTIASALYLPGLYGPFVFDDFVNITNNQQLKIGQLDIAGLKQAAFSVTPGPLGRPVAMLSFALNYLFSPTNDAFVFKATNLAIHLINAILVFLVAAALLRIGIRGHTSPPEYENRFLLLVPLILAGLWLIHPIQANAVFYIVQRMTSLSAFFVLIGLLCYLKSRLLFAGRSGEHAGYAWLFGSGIAFVLGLYTKENAILLLPLIGLIEYFFFRESAPWNNLGHRLRLRLQTGFAIISILLLISAIYYVLPGYQARTFTLGERLLTESRVLFYYLYLIAFPKIDSFGLFHDDVVLSSGLLEPVTTLVSLVGHAALITTAIRFRRTLPYLSLGITWFYVAHLLESTIVPLELVHEHRNYLALIGPLLASVEIASRVSLQARYKRYVVILVPLILLTIGTVTWLRALDWRSMEDLVIAESSYHPASARAQGALGSYLVQQGRFEEGLLAMSRARQNAPAESGYLLNMILIAGMTGDRPPKEWADQLRQSIQSNQITPLTMEVIRYVVECPGKECTQIRGLMLEITGACGQQPGVRRMYRAQCWYYHGAILTASKRFQEAVDAFDRSYALDKSLLHPLISSAYLNIRLGRMARAKKDMDKLTAASRSSGRPMGRELEQLILLYNTAIKEQAATKNKSNK